MNMPALRSRFGLPLFASAWLLLAAPLAAQPSFSFSEHQASEREEAQMESEARAARLAEQLSTPCRADLKNRKIMVVIGERRSNGIIYTQQRNYGQHYEAINRRLRALGLRTYTPEEIRRQIAQEEIDAHFRNDPDAALTAAKRLGASFILRGLISSEARPNPVMRVNQVSVTMGFTLTGSNGRLISAADASSTSYAGADVGRMALTLVNEQADEVVATLYSDYCSKAGMGARSKPAPGKASRPNATN